jgi:hypothetical protein
VNPKLRRTIWYAVNATVFVVLAVLMLTMVGPARLHFERPADRGETGLVADTYIAPPARDTITIGKRANVRIAQAEMDVEVGATLERDPPVAAWTTRRGCFQPPRRARRRCCSTGSLCKARRPWKRATSSRSAVWM